MARNEEKAQNLFNKWTAFKKDFHSSSGNRQPLLASECESIVDADKFRKEVIRDVTKKISMIQNASIGEFRIREINDEINKLMKKKFYWDTRIRELGGPEARKGRQFYDVEGQELPGIPGYRYYGAAKELPGVRELFAENKDDQEERRKRRSRTDMFKHVTPDYYGYRDDDDGILAVKELEKEKDHRAAALKDFQERKRRLVEDVKRSGGVFGAVELAAMQGSDDEEGEEQIASFLGTSLSTSVLTSGGGDLSAAAGRTGETGILFEDDEEPLSAATHAGLRAHVAVPSQESIAAILLEQKKKSLVEKYSGGV